MPIDTAIIDQTPSAVPDDDSEPGTSSASTDRSTQMELERDLEFGGSAAFHFESPSFGSDEFGSLNGPGEVDSSGESIMSGMMLRGRLLDGADGSEPKRGGRS